MTSDLYSIIQFLRNETTSFELKISTGIGHQNCTHTFIGHKYANAPTHSKVKHVCAVCMTLKCQIFAYNMTLLSVCSKNVHITYFKNYTTGV